MRTLKLWQIILSVVFVLFVALFIYGFNTDCPNTAGYVFCGEGDGLSFPRSNGQK